MIITPCKDCQNRKPYCHGKCEDYKKWREDLEKRYQERYPIYTGVCDYHVKTKPHQEQTAALIEGMFMA